MVRWGASVPSPQAAAGRMRAAGAEPILVAEEEHAAPVTGDEPRPSSRVRVRGRLLAGIVGVAVLVGAIVARPGLPHGAVNVFAEGPRSRSTLATVPSREIVETTSTTTAAAASSTSSTTRTRPRPTTTTTAAKPASTSTTTTGPTTTTTTRPAGPTAVASIDRPGLYIVDVDGSKLRRVSTEAVFRPVWSPDGRHFAYFTSAGFRVTDMNGASHQVDGTLANGRTSVVWSPDSTRLAFPGPGDGTDGTPSRDIWVVNADGSQPARPIRAPGDDAVVDWASNGRLVTASDQGLFVLNPDGSGRTRIWDRNLSGPGDLAWSPDASMVYVQPEGDYVTAVVAADGTGAHVLGEASGDTSRTVADADWTPTGDQLVGLCRYDSICRVQPDGARVWDHPFEGYELDAAPAGTNVAYFRSGPEGFRSEIRIMDTDTGAEHLAVAAPPGLSTSSFTWSPDGRSIAFTVAPAPQ